MQPVFKCPLKQAQKQTSRNIAMEKRPPTMSSSKAPKVINVGNTVHAKETHVYSSKTEGRRAYGPVFNTLWLNGVAIKVKHEKEPNSNCMATYVTSMFVVNGHFSIAMFCDVCFWACFRGHLNIM